MKNYSINGQQVNVYFASSENAGYGHKKINVKLECNGNYEKFHETTNFMHGFDKADDLEGQEKYEALYELIDSAIESEVIDWLNSL